MTRKSRHLPRKRSTFLPTIVSQSLAHDFQFVPAMNPLSWPPDFFGHEIYNQYFIVFRSASSKKTLVLKIVTFNLQAGVPYTRIVRRK